MGPLMLATLQVAVPLWAERLKHQRLADLLPRARELAQVVAEKGDVLQFKSKKRGETAKAFDALAEGLAILSFAPGGVRFSGVHFENAHPDSSGNVES